MKWRHIICSHNGKLYMKKIAVLLLVLICLKATAQTSEASMKRVDSVAQKVIVYLQQKQPDSVYAMTGLSFRNKITLENFNAISTSQIFPMTDFKSVKFVSHLQGINKYRVNSTPPMQLLVGLDADKKVETLLIQPYVNE